MDEKRMKEVLADEAFAKSLLKMDTPAEVKAALKGKGVDITEEEILQIRNHLLAAANKDGDLDEEQLKEVAGGLAPLVIPLLGLIPAIGGGIADAVRNRW